MRRIKLTENRARNLRRPDKGQVLHFDSNVKGFGVICTPGARTWFVQPRYQGRKPRIRLGAVGVLAEIGPVHAPGARDLAIAALTAARRGEDPSIAIGLRKQPEGLTLKQVWAAYEEAGFPKLNGIGHKRATTIAADRQRYRLYLEQQFGPKAVAGIDTAAARRWLDRIKSPGQRNQCLLLLTCLLTFARTRGLAMTNVIAIRSQPTRRMETFLRPEELSKLDAACVELAAENPARMLGFAALRLLIHTGCRMGEILSAERQHFDPANATLRLPRDKAGDNGREVLLSPAAVAALTALPVTSSKYLFPSRSAGGHVVNLTWHARDMFKRAGVKPVRIHDLRHSFASAAVGNGVPLYTVGALLGHRNASTTQRYAHLSRDHKREALDRVTAAIGGGSAL
jgi:integrase